MLAIATQELGLSIEEFWTSTLYEIDLFIQARRRVNRESLVGAAMVCATVANFSQFSRPETPLTVDDFLPPMDGEDPGPYRGAPRTDQELLDKARALFLVFGYEEKQ